MEILQSIATRRALRALDTAPIPQDILIRLIEAAHMAPSCMNAQPWRIITVVEPDRLEALKATLSPGNYWAKKSPAIAAFITSLDWDARLEGGRDYAFFDLGMAALAYQLQAVAEGLIAHPIAGFNALPAKAALGIPENATLVTLIILGYPGDPSSLNEKHRTLETSARERKPLEEIAHYDSWDEKLVPKK